MDIDAHLARAIKTAVDADGPVWFPSLTRGLAACGWRELSARCGLSPLGYGLDRVRQADPDAPRHIFATFTLPNVAQVSHDAILVEHPFAAESYYATLGLEFYGPDEVDRRKVTECPS
jgi:hypothetical protein